MRRDIALSHTTLAAHDGQDALDPGQLLGNAPALGTDLVGQAGAIGIGQLMVGSHALKLAEEAGGRLVSHHD